MNFSAEKSSRKWANRALDRRAAAMVTVAVAAAVLLVSPAGPALARKASHDIWGDLFGAKPRGIRRG